VCPPAALNDHIVKDWQYVHSYMMKDGHLFLSLTGAGGKYEFEPLRGSKAQTAKSPVLSADPSNLRVGKLEAATF